MKNICLIMIIVAALLTSAKTASAGFAVRKQTAKTAVITAAATPGLSRKEIRQEQLQTVRNFVGNEDHHPGSRRCSASGWEGTVAMWCGIGSLFMPVALLAAIVFGALGLGEGHRHRGRATVGLTIGVVGVFLIAMILTLSAAFS